MQLKVGAVGYTYPPTDAAGRPWSVDDGMLRPDAPLYDEPTGLATYTIRRTEYGYELGITL